jgi:LPXTG-site transpeptidase (sortase) family protein
MSQSMDIRPTSKPVARQAPLQPQHVVPPSATVAVNKISEPKPRRSVRFKLIGVAAASALIGASLLIVAFGLFAKSPVVTPPTATAPSADEGVLPTASAAETKQSPWRLSIPSIDLDAVIQEVGLTPEGNMGVPSNYTDVGWFKSGPRIGKPGNAVLAGHLNSGPNSGAVFQNLHKLQPGDIIYVKDKNMQQRFRVIGSQSYVLQEAPMNKIFGSTDKAQLNLITCSGSWDKDRADYDQRLVVFTELVP